ncbi:MAG: glycosyltransferase family 1 protein [Thalassobium sp.]|nr:MAG: glycosyltransferase family 1 protein [Thalassobium sp.]
MKVLLVAGYAESLVTFRGDLIKRMLNSNIEIHVACPGINLSIQDSLMKNGVILHDIPLKRTGTNPIEDIKSLFALRHIMRDINPDAVLAYTIKPVIYGMLAASMASVPRRFALITGLGYAFTGSAKGIRGVIRGIVRRLYKAALLQSNIVFFQNPDDAALFKKLGIIGANIPTRIVNGSGVDTAQYAVTALPETPVFLLIARLLGDKGVREYAKAAQLVKQKYPAVCFDLVGWIDENPDAIRQQELDEWIAAGVVNFKGKLSDVRPAIAASSVYVLPSYREGTPRTVLEAMAMGRAIITTDAPGCRETVQDGVNGKLVAVKSVVELADAMIEIIENPELIRQYGKNSRLIAEEKYDVHKVNSFMLNEMGLI